MKKMLMILIAGILLLSVVGCSNKKAVGDDVYQEANENEDVNSGDKDTEDADGNDVDDDDNDQEENDVEKETIIEGTLEELMDALYSGVDKEFPKTMHTVIEGDNIAYFLGTNELTFVEALGSEPMMSSIAHSVALIRVEEGTDMEVFKNKIKENVDPRKWICVGVEEDQVIVDHIGDLVVLIMDEDAKKLHESFLNLKDGK